MLVRVEFVCQGGGRSVGGEQSEQGGGGEQHGGGHKVVYSRMEGKGGEEEEEEEVVAGVAPSRLVCLSRCLVSLSLCAFFCRSGGRGLFLTGRTLDRQLSTRDSATSGDGGQ